MLFRRLVILLFASSLSGCIATGTETALLERVSAGGLSISLGGARKEVLLEVNIADWRVTCDRRRAIVWGQTTRQLPTGVPPYAMVYVVDLIRAVARESFATTRGPFEVQVNEAGTLGVVDEYVVDLASGEVKLTEIPRDLDFRAESCSDFRGRRLLP